MASQFLRVDDVCQQVGLAKSTVYKLVADGEFPPPIHPTPRTSAWISEEVNGWQAQRIAASRQKAAA